MRHCPSHGTLIAHAHTPADDEIGAHIASCEHCRQLLALAESSAPVGGTDEDLTQLLAVRYTRDKLLGRGGQALLWRAYDRVLRRHVAYKTPRADIEESAQRGSITQLASEARVLASLDHPNIPSPIDLGVDPNGLPFFTQPVLVGRTLRKHLADTESLEARISLLPKMSAIARAIAHANEHEILHRDIKPENVIIDEHGHTHVIDWGLAQLMNEPRGEARVVGTPSYMSPEQARGEVEIDARSDVWSLGAVLYELLTGAPPNKDEPYRFSPQVPVELATICGKALADDPRQRYASAAKLVADLDAYQSGRLVRTHDYRPWHVIAKAFYRHRLPVIVSVASACVLAVILAFVVRSARETTAALARESRARGQALQVTGLAHLDKATGYARSQHFAARAHAASALQHFDKAKALGTDTEASHRARARGVLLVSSKLPLSRQRWSITEPANDVMEPRPLAFSPNGRWLASAASSSVTIIRTEDGSRQATFELPTGRRVISIAWSPSSARLAVSDTYGASLWTPTGQRLARYDGVSAYAHCVAFIDDDTLMMGDVGGRLRRIDVRAPSQVLHADIGPGLIEVFALGSGRLGVIATIPAKFYVVDGQTLQTLRTFDTEPLPTTARLNAAGKVVYRSRKRLIELDPNTGSERLVLDTKSYPITTAVWLSGLNAYAYATRDGKGYLLRPGNESAVFQWQMPEGGYAFAYHRDVGLAIASGQGLHRLYELSGDTGAVFGHDKPDGALFSQVSPNGGHRLTALTHGLFVETVDRQGKALSIPYIGGWAFPSDNNYLVVSTRVGYRIFETDSWTMMHSGNVGDVRAAKLSGDSRSIAVALADGTVQVIRLDTNARVVLEPGGEVDEVAISHDGSWLVTSGERGLLIYDLASVPPRSRQVSRGRFNKLALSPDGTKLASGGLAGLSVWSVPGGEDLAHVDTKGVYWRLRWVGNHMLYTETGKTRFYRLPGLELDMEFVNSSSPLQDGDSVLVEDPDSRALRKFPFAAGHRDPDAVLDDLRQRYGLRLDAMTLRQDVDEAAAEP